MGLKVKDLGEKLNFPSQIKYIPKQMSDLLSSRLEESIGTGKLKCEKDESQAAFFQVFYPFDATQAVQMIDHYRPSIYCINDDYEGRGDADV
jgi:hypothetical protein